MFKHKYSFKSIKLYSIINTLALTISASSILLLLLSSNLSARICQFNSYLLRSFDDVCSFLSSGKSYSRTNIVSNFSTKGSIVHQKHIEILRVVDHKLLQTVGKEEFRCIIRTISNFWHFFVASKASSHSVVDTCMG